MNITKRSKPKKRKPQAKATRAEQRHALAIHEAAHAVVDFVLQRRFQHVTIKPGDDYQGCVKPIRRAPTPRQSLWEVRGHIEDLYEPQGYVLIDNDVAALYAGAIAEKRFSGRWNPAGARADLEDVEKLAIARHGAMKRTELKSYLKWRFVAARRLVNVFWPEIELIAAALLKHKRLTYGQVQKLLEKKWAPTSAEA